MSEVPLDCGGDVFRHLHLQDSTSTNYLCLARAREGDPGQLWITARRQTVGKGSRGRSWVSEPGNLYASLLLIDPAPPGVLAQLAFVASLAVRDAIIGIAPDFRNDQVKVKWPNDVMLAGKKCAGILVESRTVGIQSQVAIGIGVNCEHYPTSTNHPATSLKEQGVDASPKNLFPHLAQAMALWLRTWQAGDGFPEVRKTWLSHAAQLGEEIKVTLPHGEQHVGTFTSVDGHGYMMLRRADDVIERISVADIFPVETPTSGEMNG